MKNRLVITITDLEGTTHYNVHQVIKKIIVGGIFGIILFFIISSYLITFLMNDVTDLERKRDTLRKEKIKYEKNIAFLNKKMNDKTNEIEVFTDRLEEIETIIGLNPQERTEISLEERFDLAAVTSLQKQYMLSNIPNGNPLFSDNKSSRKVKITDKFGSRTHPIKKTRVFHKGIDIKAKTGTPVYATADGIIEYSGYKGKNSFGNLVILSHNYGFKSYYAHLSKLKYKIGDIVKKGQLIAYSGNTGLSSGPHLHYEVRYLGIPLDPINFVNWNINNYASFFEKSAGIKWPSLVKMITEHQQVKTQEQLLSQVALK